MAKGAQSPAPSPIALNGKGEPVNKKYTNKTSDYELIGIRNERNAFLYSKHLRDGCLF